MNILITGGTGYIGSHTAIKLLQKSYSLVLLDNLQNSQRETIQKLQELSGKDITFIEGDILDTELLFRTLLRHKIEVVIHFAGLKSVSDSMKYPLEYFKTNVSGSLSLFNAMDKAEVRNLVFSSSATVYGTPNYLPYDENHQTVPNNTYGKTKLQVEQILRSLSESNSAWRICCLRYFNPVGAHKSGLIGERPCGVPNNLMPYITQVATGKLKCLPIFGANFNTPDGTAIRDYIHVEDLASGHVSALQYLIDEGSFETINLGTGKGVSVKELVECFENATNIKIPHKFTKRRPGDLPIFYANPSKALKLLNWSAKHNLNEMCIDSLEYEKFYI
jgi:UDP-glucose 4-epimerase